MSWSRSSLMTIVLCVLSAGSPTFAHQKVDADCARFAQFVQSLDVLKQAGYTANDQQAFISTPKVAPYPVEYIQGVLTANDWTPKQAYDAMYAKCTFYGFAYLTTVLKQEQATAALKQQVADLTHELSDTQTVLLTTQKQLLATQAQLKEATARHRRRAPVLEEVK